MLYGVRLLINQIIPAFQGDCRKKVVPGAKPAFDVPILFNYRPNAVIIGFIVATNPLRFLVVLANSFHLFGVLLVPLVITSFFECGGAAVIGEGQRWLSWSGCRNNRSFICHGRISWFSAIVLVRRSKAGY